MKHMHKIHREEEYEKNTEYHQKANKENQLPCLAQIADERNAKAPWRTTTYIFSGKLMWSSFGHRFGFTLYIYVSIYRERAHIYTQNNNNEHPRMYMNDKRIHCIAHI